MRKTEILYAGFAVLVALVLALPEPGRTDEGMGEFKVDLSDIGKFKPTSSPPADRHGSGSLMSGVYATNDIMALIASTGEGNDLLGHFQMGEVELPEIIYEIRLTEAERKMLSGATIKKEDRVALFIKNKDFRNNRPHIILFKSGWPLFASACITASLRLAQSV